jgi:hypothetical protein
VVCVSVSAGSKASRAVDRVLARPLEQYKQDVRCKRKAGTRKRKRQAARGRKKCQMLKLLKMPFGIALKLKLKHRIQARSAEPSGP